MAVLTALVVLGAPVTACAGRTGRAAPIAARPSSGAVSSSASSLPPSSPSPAPSAAPSGTAPSAPVAAPPPAGLTVIDYTRGPQGLPADPEPQSTAAPGEGARPTVPVTVYDAPGGRPRAILTPTISGVPVTVPIVAREAGWVAVLVPTANRTVGWLPPTGWVATPLRDHLVLRRAAHEFTWYRDGAPYRAWTVTVGSSATPTPLGRTFVLGRSRLPGRVYGGLDVLALGSVPDDRNAVPTGLRGAHIGIHSWYRDDWGRSISNGCIRVPKAGQQALLAELVPGTPVIVLP